MTQMGCAEAPVERVVLHPFQSPFDIHPDDARLASEYERFMVKRDAERPVYQEYLPPETGLNSHFTPEDLMSVVRKFTRDQTSEDSLTFATGADPILATEDAFTDLRNAVTKLVRLGNVLGSSDSEERGLRDFVRDFAYFLRRSCLDRPGGEQLDVILRLVFADSCFAYGNGEYLTATPEDPQWRRCMEEAGL
jgi:hypothetical protein